MTRRGRLANPVPDHQRGSITLWFLFTLTFLLMFGAFAVDMPRVFSAHDELQNAADAAALAGASALSTGTSVPNWSAAAAAAAAAVTLNTSDGKQLSTGTVMTGYWNLAASPASILAPSSVTLPAPAGQLPEPAVQVTIKRDASDNGGLVTLLLGALVGTPATAESATAVAVITPPASVPAGGLFPVVMDQCVFDQYWNSNTNQPEIDPSTNQAYEFEIGNGQQYGSSCEAGDWTSFTTVSNNVPTIRNLIANGNPTALSIGDNIYIEPGVKTTIYSSVPTGVTVVMPVAAQVSSKSYVPIVAFAAFHIDGSYGGSSKYIQGHFVGGYTMPTQGSGVGTSSYGSYSAPRLAF
ncbi:pilus assembly protein TadG-related protein [Paraburkholderia haematera]|uniref:pilus assembly protein TadG-related protein n=1 Tax=Paraburkholderia haematera TaxID=2793077 RepID=UPI001B8CCB30|nr:pilus assembly protein TadG-related protein [Paraburkholderia haematera]